MKTINYNPNDNSSQGADAGDRGRASNGDVYQYTGANWELTSDNPGPQGGSDRRMSFEDTVKRSIALAQEANKPAVATLQGEIDPLKAQYDTLLASIKGEQTKAVNQSTVDTNNELGKRGILPSSGLAANEVSKKLEATNTSYNSLYANTGVAEQEDIGNINNAIAQLQAGNTTTGINLGSNWYNANTNANQFAQTQAANLAQNTTNNALEQSKINASNTNSGQWTYGSGGLLYNTGTGETKNINQTATTNQVKSTWF